MRISLRKGSEHVRVTYMNDWGISLYASDFTVVEDDGPVVLSMDFSSNQRTRREDSKAYMDAVQLLNQVSEVKFFQIHYAKWLDGLTMALKRNPEASFELELRFKDGVTHSFPCSLDSYNGLIEFRSLNAEAH